MTFSSVLNVTTLQGRWICGVTEWHDDIGHIANQSHGVLKEVHSVVQAILRRSWCERLFNVILLVQDQSSRKW